MYTVYLCIHTNLKEDTVTRIHVFGIKYALGMTPILLKHRLFSVILFSISRSICTQRPEVTRPYTDLYGKEQIWPVTHPPATFPTSGSALFLLFSAPFPFLYSPFQVLQVRHIFYGSSRCTFSSDQYIFRRLVHFLVINIRDGISSR